MDKPNKKVFLGGWIPKRNSGWLILLVCVSGWMFFLGVLVGRGTAPVKFDIDKLQRELAALKAADLKKQLGRVENSSDSSQLKKDLGFYEALKDTKDDSKRSSKRKADRTSEKSPSASQTDAKKKKKVNPTNSSRNDASRKAKKTPSDIGTDGPKNLTIQAASFKDPKDADKMVAMLKKKGYPAYRIIGVVPEKGVWYRVRIGAYGSRTEAATTMKKLQEGGLKPYLVKP